MTMDTRRWEDSDVLGLLTNQCLGNWPEDKEQEERQLAESWVQEIAQFLDKRGVEVSPFTMMRMYGVLSQYWLLRRIERHLYGVNLFPVKEKPVKDRPETEKSAPNKPATQKSVTDKPPTDKSGTGKQEKEKKEEEKAGNETYGVQPALEPYRKFQEGVRKAMKELEDIFPPAETLGDVGLADIMKPILEKAEGVLEECLEEESRRESAVVEDTEGPICQEAVEQPGAIGRGDPEVDRST